MGIFGASSVAVRGLVLGGADAYAGPMSKAWFALAVIALVLLAVLGRYAVTPIPAPDLTAEGMALLLDRWTGITRPVCVAPWREKNLVSEPPLGPPRIIRRRATAPTSPVTNSNSSVLPPEHANKEEPFVNSLGMKFVPVPGTGVLFSVWDTRVGDFLAYAEATEYKQKGGIGVWRGAQWELDKNASWESPGFAQGEDYPVVGVGWEEAEAFCDWLTHKERSEGKIGPSQEYRLPTDKEWSAACAGKKYAWGDQWPPPKDVGNYDPSLGVDSYENTSPCGQFEANNLGLYDIGGNVWQWTSTRYSRADDNVLKEYPWLEAGQAFRTVRGASWRDGAPESMRSVSRGGGGRPKVRLSNVGFRCVLGDKTFCSGLNEVTRRLRAIIPAQ